MTAVTSCDRKRSTRACLWDFDPNVTDARMSLLVGYLCESCGERLKEQLSEYEVRQLRDLLNHRWIGRVEDPGSVASNLKRVFNFDLSRTRGMAPTIMDDIRRTGFSEIVKWLVAGSLGILSFRAIEELRALIGKWKGWPMN